MIFSARKSHRQAVARRKEKGEKNFIHFVDYYSMNKKSQANKWKSVQLTREKKNEIDQFYIDNYGKKVRYDWHRLYAYYNGTINKTYIPSPIYLSEIEPFFNMYSHYNDALEDKSLTPLIMESVQIRTPYTIYSSHDNLITDHHMNIVEKDVFLREMQSIGEVFIKPTSGTCGGRGCFKCNVKNGIDLISGEPIEKILRTSGNYFTVQEVIKNHKSISEIYDKSLNTFRVVTYRWKDSIYNAPVIMRMGRNGATVDNASSGGIFIGVYNNGKLRKYAYEDYMSPSKGIPQHPDSGIKFADYKIISIENVIETARKAHRTLPKIGLVNWDFCLDETGTPILIEANIVRGEGNDFVSVAWEQGLFGEHTAEILQWARVMKTLKIQEREKYIFGTGDWEKLLKK